MPMSKNLVKKKPTGDYINQLKFEKKSVHYLALISIWLFDASISRENCEAFSRSGSNWYQRKRKPTRCWPNWRLSGRKPIQIFIRLCYVKYSKDTIPYFFYYYFSFDILFDILFDFDCLNPLAFILIMSFLFKSFRYLFCIFRPRRKSLLESFSDLTSRMFRKPSLDEPDFFKPSLVEPNCNEHEPSKNRQPFMQFVTRSRVSRTAIWNCTYWLTLFIISNDCCKNSYFAYLMYYLLRKIYTHIL